MPRASLKATAIRRGAMIIVLVVISGCGGTAAGVKGIKTTAATVTVPHADRFAPFTTMVTHGSRVTFYNSDSDEHTVVSVPGDPLALNLVLAPGQSLTITVGAGGAHRYFCSIHARYDPATGQIAANPNADHPDEPMEGVIIANTT